jgi:hypothetical protein
LLECKSIPAYSFISGSSLGWYVMTAANHQRTLRLRSRLEDYQA